MKVNSPSNTENTDNHNDENHLMRQYDKMNKNENEINSADGNDVVEELDSEITMERM